MLHSGVSATYGIEVDAVKCQKAVPFVGHIVKELEEQGIMLNRQALPKFICAPIEQVRMPCMQVRVWMYVCAEWLGVEVWGGCTRA